ncbi:MAG: cytochrome c oxidase accessory protein CcoG [Flavobacteriales bacterium]
MAQIKPSDNFRDKISTVDEKGKRVWVFAKKPFGKWFNKRQVVSYSLLLFLFSAPFITINGEPLLMFNIIERKFVIFGKIFWPQDFYIFAIASLTFLVFIVLFTLVFGRIFCGWFCPQTIFMEFVFRRIEYWIEGDWTHQKRLERQPWNREKIIKKSLKHSIFFLIAFLVANIFLSYIIGYKELFKIITDNPLNHIGGLIAIVVFSFLFYGVFAFMREQVCTTICPYGRLQGVLLDPDSMVITYDYVRGENRSKFRKNEDRAAEGKGDCIDCNQCVNVCPTGIDIRNGTQLECVNCTACIDACDHIMESIEKPKGLIRYASDASIKTGITFKFSKKAKAYTAVLVILLGVLTTLIISRSDFSLTVQRTAGSKLFHEMEDNKIGNLYTMNVLNKTNSEMPLEFKLIEGDGEIKIISDSRLLPKQGNYKSSFIIMMNEDNIENIKTYFKIGVYSNGKLIDKTNVTFIGPSF